MARYIHCDTCNKKMAALASKCNEFYESIEGVALRDMFCDGGCFSELMPTQIKRGDKCYAAVLLNNSSHPNYEIQKPEMWATEYIAITSQYKSE